MKPVIGIVARPFKSEENNNMYAVYEDIKKVILLCGGIPIGIFPNDSELNDNIKICDGIILQGGNESYDYEKTYLSYAYHHDIPVLGICLGMQLMGEVFGGNLIEAQGHKLKDKNYAHSIDIIDNTVLHSILGLNNMVVNSRHKSALEKTNLTVSALSNDGVIEAIEDSSKKFFIGVQWHPENLAVNDINQRKLFKYFIDVCGDAYDL